MKSVVIVESPSKAKTINKYLGNDYSVFASFGHVRDLPPKDGSVRPDDDFAMDWTVDKDSNKRLNDIAAHVKEADRLYLATDPDREGEAISWHVLEVLNKKKALKSVDVKRIVFNEITKSAVLKAISEPREVDQQLVDAYLARRALDYLVGFTLSPVLWRKLPGARSAGRVQSVALRMVCERESEIERFKSEEYWTVETDVVADGRPPFKARLTALKGDKLKKMSLGNEASAMEAVEAIKRSPLSVTAVEAKPQKRSPSPPFTTSTLQQEASRKLGFSASRTMQVAQKLYEGKTIKGETVGLITYMRTDGVSMAREAVEATRQAIMERYGDRYVPENSRGYKTKARNAQEAHEAVRPTDPRRKPVDIAGVLTDEERKLYELIWRRTLASQMENAVLERTTIDMDTSDGGASLRATGTVTKFEGFFAIYQEGRDDASPDEADAKLPPVKVGEAITAEKINPVQHFTEPPPRYSEASLVKALEENGIGRPSTYASILQVLREREYVHMDKNRFIPEDKGRLVTAFLEKFFERYVAYDFTASLEEQLDHISAGERAWRDVLRTFWMDFKPKTEEVINTRNKEVIDRLEEYLSTFLFGPEGEATRVCPSCSEGTLNLKTSRYGAFVGCSRYPECRYTRPFGASEAANDTETSEERVLGEHDQTGKVLEIKNGRFGLYIEEAPDEGEKPRRASIPKDVDPVTLDLKLAIALIDLPRTVGDHPETGKPITASIGRYGPYVAHERTFASLKTTEDVFTVGLNHAVSLIADKASKRGGSANVLKELGDHPDGGPIQVLEGRYGPYVKYKRVNATLPKDKKPEEVTLEEALALIEAKSAKKKPAAKKKAPAKKTAAKKPAAKKKAPAKKAAAKKPASKAS